MKLFYVYEWYICESNEVFYVGKGTGDRYLETRRRNKMFKDIYNTHNCNVRFVKSNLTEEESFELEKETIAFYKNNTKYRISNQTDGGTGGNTRKYYSQEELKMYSEKASKKRKGIINQGSNNPMFKKTWKYNKSENEILEISEKIRKSNLGKTPSIETREKMSISAKNREFKLPPMKKRPCMIVEKKTLNVVEMYDGIREAKDNIYVKGNLSRKAKGIVANKNEEYMILYTYYHIDDKDNHPNI